MNTDRENWIEGHMEEYEFLKSIEWIEEKYPKVYEQFMKDLEEHGWGCKHDAYYRYCYGGGKVPTPCCAYCVHFDPSKDACTKDWNNLDDSYYIPDRDDREPGDLCECYEWNGEWEDD